jgi:Putative adhesin
MPEFPTPDPIEVDLDVLVGDVRIVAGERADTVVDVRPANPHEDEDVSAAEATRVELDGGRLLVKSTRRWRSYSPFGHGGAVDVEIALPAGSRVTGELAVGAFRSAGALGDCRLKTGVGEVRVDQAASVRLRTGMGDVAVDRATGDADVSTGSGELEIGDVAGAATLKNSNGGTRIGFVAGDLRVNSANGDIAIDGAGSTLVAKTANGDIRVGAVRRGSIVTATGLGGIEIAVPEGVAAFLDLHTGYGTLSSELEAGGPPAPGEDSVEVRARSGAGDIAIRRIEALA